MPIKYYIIQTTIAVHVQCCNQYGQWPLILLLKEQIIYISQ